MKHLIFACGMCVLAGCGGSEKTGKVAGPGLTSASPATLPADAYKKAGPVTAAFVDLSPAGTTVHVEGCQDVIVAVAHGHANALKQDLGEGDEVIDRTVIPNDFSISGEGVAVVATVSAKCAGSFPPATKISASAAPDLAWANGTMHAHLDAVDQLHGDAYFGRLAGTASVPEHMHDGSWEILIAIEGSGTFTIDGKPQHLGAREVVGVPPNTKHSWTPDNGVKLIAFQIYTPPGPEQRFKALAAGTK